MADREPLGILGVDSIHYYVHDLDRMGDFLTQKLDFAELGAASDETVERSGQRSRVYRAGEATLTVSQPVTDSCRAARWLRKHPEGVGTIVFAVEDIERTFRLLEERGGTFITDIDDHDVDGGTYRTFNITTPFGDTTFRFVQKIGTDVVFPGFEAHDPPRGGSNRFGISVIDHITSNFQTMRPMLLWMEHVMGFQKYWEVAFHTVDVDEQAEKGSGLKSEVMYDPHSKVKFANNEPTRPFFKASQINLFGEDHRGDGVQHIALITEDIQATVRGLRERGVEFMPTPDTYYDMLPDRLKAIGVNAIEEDIEVLRELQILVDGEADRSYMLQIFLKEQAGLFNDKEAGPFFLEIIERKGDRGFGAGNFRALFESIERQQEAEGRIA